MAITIITNVTVMIATITGLAVIIEITKIETEIEDLIKEGNILCCLSFYLSVKLFKSSVVYHFS